MATDQIPDSALTQQVPGFRFAVYQDCTRKGRYRTLQEALDAHGCCTYTYTADGWRIDAGGDAYTVKMERSMRWPFRMMLMPALWFYDSARWIKRHL